MKVKNVLQKLIVIAIVVLLTGCASTLPMSLDANPGQDPGKQQQLLLLALTTRNNYHQMYQPIVQNVVIRGNGKDVIYLAGRPYNTPDNELVYLFSFSLAPGDYQLRTINGYSGNFPFHGTFTIPMYTHFSVGNGGVVYLGHVNANLEKRTSDSQLRGGVLIPLVDQAATGFSMGTFDINIFNNMKNDIFSFQNQYPVLIDIKIQKNILPQWTEPTAATMSN